MCVPGPVELLKIANFANLPFARNLMMGTLGKGDKSVIQRKLLFKFYNNCFISTSNSEQEEQTNREKYVFYCSASQIHINPEKTRKTAS